MDAVTQILPRVPTGVAGLDDVLEAIQRLKPQRVVIDSLSEIRLLAQSSLRCRRQIWL